MSVSFEGDLMIEPCTSRVPQSVKSAQPSVFGVLKIQ